MKAANMILTLTLGAACVLLLAWKFLYIRSSESITLSLDGKTVEMRMTDKQKRFFGNHILGVGGGDYSTRIQWDNGLPKWNRAGAWRPVLVFHKQGKALVVLKRYYASPVPYEVNALADNQWKVLEKDSDYLDRPLTTSEVDLLSGPLLLPLDADEKKEIQDWLKQSPYPKLWN